jgi:hypothetical protein
MGIDDDEFSKQERLAAWRHAPGLEPCPNCKECSLDPEKKWCRNCELSEEKAWEAFNADDKW